MLNKIKLSLLILLSPIFCHAEMVVIDDFTGGKKVSVTPFKMNPKYSPRVYNMDPDNEIGSMSKFNGTTFAGATNTLSSINYIGVLNLENGARHFIISDSSLVLATQDFTSYQVLRTAQNPAYRFNGIQVENDFWLTNGFDSVFKFDGSSVTILDGKTYSGVKTPNVPRGKYILYEQGIVWMFSTTMSASGLSYSSDISTDTVPIALAADSEYAWPVTNELNIGKGDGDNPTSLFSYKGRPHCGKENSIYTIFGNNEDNYSPVKTLSKTGISNDESVVIGDDNFVRFFWRGAFYKFDGNNSVKVSDSLDSELSLAQSNSQDIITTLWDTQSDFLRGSFNGATVNVSGLLAINSTMAINNLGIGSLNSGNSIDFVFNGGSTSTHYLKVTSDVIRGTDFPMGMYQAKLR